MNRELEDELDDNPDPEPVMRECITKFKKEPLYLISTDGAISYRPFFVSHEHTNPEGLKSSYLHCVKCNTLRKKEALGLIKSVAPIGSTVLRNGRLDVKRKIKHNKKCIGEPLEKLLAKNEDRTQRERFRYCKTELAPKSFWREGYNRLLEKDIKEELDPLDPESLSYHYPSYDKVRRQFNKIRQQRHGPLSQRNQFDIPIQLMLTKSGSIKLALGKELSEEDK